MGKTKCKARKEDGQKCAAFAAKDSEYCFWHNPANRKAVVEADRTGGSRGKLAVLPADGPDLPCTSPQEALQAVQTLIGAVAKGQVDPRVANAASTLLNVWKTLYEMARAADTAQRADEQAGFEHQLDFAEIVYGLASEGKTLHSLAEQLELGATEWFQAHDIALPERYQRNADLRRAQERDAEIQEILEKARKRQEAAEGGAALEEADSLAAGGQVASETR